jgi:HD domain
MSESREAAVERLIVELGAALQQRGVYPSGHPQVRRAVERTIAAHRELLALEPGATETTALAVEGQLIVDRVPVPESAPWTRGVLTGLARHEISGITLMAELDEAELAAFLDSTTSAAGPTSSRHLLVGRVGFRPEEPGAGGATREEALPALAPADELEQARADFCAPAGSPPPGVDRLRSLVAALARAVAGARLEAPRLAGDTPGEREFVHALATALGTLRLARAIGVEGDRLLDLGLAGMLHDVGRIEVGPDAGEPALRSHPVVGAGRIAAMPGAPALAVVTAYEHHLRFDGGPNYPTVAAGRAPCAAAQIVAVADTWDTLRSRGRLPAPESIRLLRARAPGYLNPDLVGTFVALVGDVE